jgi:transposase InsO family protein
MLQPTIRWFHQVTGHPGSKRLHMQISSRYYHRDLRRLIDSYKCDHCQRHKLDGKGYGHLPEREIRSMPFEECAVDLIGPWKVQVRTKPYKFSALTIIDTVSNLVELVRIDEKTSAHIAKKFAQVWLTRYPWPARCIHDNGGEFIGPEFQLLLEGCRIKDVPTTSKNPQANSICERMHQTVGNVLRTLLHGQPPQQITGARAKEFIDEALSITMHAVRAGMHSTLGSSPGSLVFNRDMFLNIPLIADWHAVTKRREHLVNENLMRENRKRRRHDYAIDNRVLKKRHNPTRLGLRTIGPFKVVQTHVNGTVTIELRHGVTERINIRRIIPYNE